MAFKGIDSARTLDYRSPGDPDQDNPTVFVLRSPSRRVMNWLNDQAIADEGAAEGNIMLANPMQLMWNYVQFGLVGLRNFLDEKDQPIEFTTERRSVPGVGNVEVVASDLLDRFPPGLVIELATQVQALALPSEEEVKNSAGSS